MDAKAIWQSGVQFRGSSDSQHEVMMDGNGQAGIGPVEMVLTALAGCTGMDVIAILEKKRQQVTRFEVRADGERSPDYPKVFTELSIHYIVHGEAVDPTAVERAIELSSTKYCPVQKMLSAVAPVSHTYEIVEEVAASA